MDIDGSVDVLKILNPATTRLWRDRVGNLCLEVRLADGEPVQYEKVRPMRAFPLSAPEEFITFFGEKNDYLGMLESLDGVDERTEELLRAELEVRYLLPQIVRIDRLRLNGGVISWRVETDRGPRTFDVRDRDEIRFMPGHRIVIKDVDGNRFEIPDYWELDDWSYSQLEQLL
ncbi:MAG: DUF1854 domain-containing protein [Armatimonadetes bacterium]|nr:DUF1854 domain-containing protein [Armatimonadota bacterium]